MSDRHPNEERFRAQIRRSVRVLSGLEDTGSTYAEGYWKGHLDAFRLVAVDLGYSHTELDEWVRDE